jgi:UrcA family protein
MGNPLEIITMNTDTYTLRCFRLRVAVRTAGLMALLAITPVTVVAGLMALVAIAPVRVVADTPPAPALETRAVKVSLADLDLSTPEGLGAARDRLHQTARRLCSQLEDMRSIAHQPAFIKCVDESLADALRQITAPLLVSVPGSHDAPR